MDKINFENLPSENTPINEDNLNLMQSNIEKSVVAVGKTQPSTSENVWLKKGKNLFDKNKIVAGYILAQDGSIVPPSNSEASSDYIAIESSNPYTFSASNYTVPTGGLMWLAISLFDSNKNIIARYADYNINSITVTASQTVNAKYIRVSYRYNDSNIKCQLEYGSTATTYEPYVEKEILIKNDNNVFEKFYSEKVHYKWEYATLSNYVGGTVIYVKIGNLVIVQFDDFMVKENISSSGTVLASGLPKSNKYIRTELVSFTYPLQAFRVAINEEGNIVAHYSNRDSETGTNFYGSLIYLTD